MAQTGRGAPCGASNRGWACLTLLAFLAATVTGCSIADDDEPAREPTTVATDRHGKAPRNALRFDWNGDAREDLAWQDRNTKALTVWRMAGTSLLGATPAGRTTNTLFSVRARLIGSDPCFDQVEYDGTTLTVIDRFQDLASNTCVAAGQPGPAQAFRYAPAGWSLVAVEGSYDGSRQNQVLWRHATGTVGIWKLAPDGSVAASGFPATVPPRWTLADARGDYDGDGRSDLLWRDSDGTVAIWRMTSLDRIADVAFIGTAPPERWTLADGAGDYDGDGRSDLLWVDADGNVVIWSVDLAGGSFRARPLGSAGPGWRVLDGSSDLNGDARSDIVWQHASGAVAVWLVNQTGVIDSRQVGVMDPAWELVSRSRR